MHPPRPARCHILAALGPTLAVPAMGQSFEPPVTIASLLSGPSYAAVADFTGDGLPDVATIANSGNQLVLSVQQPSKTFAQHVVIDPLIDGPWTVRAGDLDGDGDQDLAVATYDSGQNLW